MLPVQVNILAVVVTAVVNMVVGSLWYSPLLFGKQWIKLSGMKMGDPNMPMWMSYGATFVGALLMNYVLAYFSSFAFAYTPVEGAMVGMWAWLGFIATSSLSTVVFGGKPKGLYLIDNGYYLTVLLINGALLAWWR